MKKINNDLTHISLIYTELKLQDYFLPINPLNNKQCNLLFSLHSCMVPVRTHFSHSYSELTFPVCLDKNQRDTQIHLLHCKKLLAGENLLVGSDLSYDDIFSSDVTKQAAVVILLEKLLAIRRNLEKKSSHVSDPSDPNCTSLWSALWLISYLIGIYYYYYYYYLIKEFNEFTGNQNKFYY